MSGESSKKTWVVVKVNGWEEGFEQEKIADSIFLAAQEASGTDEDRAQELAELVMDYLGKQFGRMKRRMWINRQADNRKEKEKESLIEWKRN